MSWLNSKKRKIGKYKTIPQIETTLQNSKQNIDFNENITRDRRKTTETTKGIKWNWEKKLKGHRESGLNGGQAKENPIYIAIEFLKTIFLME